MDWKWKVAEEVIKKVVNIVTSADKAYQTLKEQGYKVTRADVRGAWTDYNRETFYSGPLSQWDTKRPIPKAWITPVQTRESEGIQRMLTYELYNPETGEKTLNVWSRVSDEPEPFANVIDAALEDLVGYATFANLELRNIRPSGIRQLVTG